jgi:hypothetical protein
MLPYLRLPTEKIIPSHPLSSRMDLHLTHNPPAQYKSRSQISKSLTERWFAENMYCPACPSESLEQTPPNEKVVDFVCPRCEEKYQLKGMAHAFGAKIVDSAYEPKFKIIKGLKKYQFTLMLFQNLNNHLFFL